MTRNLTRQFGWVWINMILLACLPSIASAQTIPCAPNCQDINVSITGTGPNEFHAKIAWTDFIRNFDCAAPVTYTLQTISGANVARGSSDDAGNEVYFIVGNPCDYLDRELMLTVTNALGSCMSMVTFHKGMLNFSGRSFDYYCLDPNVEAPQATNYPDPFMACDGLVIPRWVADWPFTKDCSGATVDTAKVIFREWEVIDKDGMRYVAYDTITVHRLPALDREHLYCQAQDTLYCGESPLFGPYLVIPSAPGSLDCDTIPLVSVHNDSGRITFQAMELNQSCGFQMHLDTMRFSTGCNSMYRLDLEIKQICPGLPNPALCLVPLNNDIEQVDASGAYWRCSFWVLDIDTLPPVARCDYSKFGGATVLWPDKADDDQPGHCFSTPANPGTQLNAPIVVLSTYSHQCAALATLPDLCIEDDWSGIGQVKAQINGIGSYVLQPGISCDSGVIYTFDGVVELPMREQPYQILYEVRDACHNVDSIYCYVLVKDGTKPTAIAAKGVTVALGGKTTWVEAQSFDEGSFDACQINLLLARRTDWFTAGVDLCDQLDSLCT
ncbi:MAG: hypothetical protein HKN76_07080, partial [Saprospiraceae bacterium]|nr:hypothetical protein [Saprospiraceae bacterium]